MITTFNLWIEPWIRVLTLDGRETSLSMRDTLAQAHRLQRVAGELPTQDAAVFRLLLAVLYRALPITDSRPGRQWRRWWDLPELPMAEVDEYLGTHLGRFDLLHPQAPFAQVAGLAANKTSGLGKIIGDLPDGEQHFTTRAGVHAREIGLAEAARWVVHAHAYDPSGIKTGAYGDDRVKGGKGYPLGTGWAGQCGLVLAEGATLKESLLLSFVRHLDESEDSVWWERAPVTAAASVDHGEPAGPADLLTWLARRMLLHVRADESAPDGSTGVVTDVLLSYGDPVHPQNRFPVEPHCGWRFSDPQSKKLGQVVYMPRVHDPERAIWRGLPSLLARIPPPSGRPDSPAPAMEPGVVRWLADLVQDGHLEASHPVHLRAVGASFGSQSSTIAAVIDDSVRLQAAVFADEALRLCAVHAVEAGDAAARAVRHLADNLAKAAGRNDGSGHTDVEGMLFARLDPAYRRWITSLGPGVDPDERLSAWHVAVFALASTAADELVSQASDKAWAGRAVRVGGANATPMHLDAALAHIFCLAALRRALPGANPHAPSAAVPSRTPIQEEVTP